VITGLLFAASLVLIVGGSELFTNAVEWAGFRLKLASGATGSLLAALGTALPETAVPVVALISRAKTSDAVAVGAIVGAPFLLITLGMAVTGLAVMSRRRQPDLDLDAGQVRRDLGSVGAGFCLLLLGVILPVWARAICAVALLLLYARYVRATLRGGAPSESMPEPLHLLRWDEDLGGRPYPWAIAVQLGISVAMLVVGAEFFVHALERLATAVSLSPLLLSLVLVPLATELPETLNSVLWVRAGSDGLAFGNVAGATTFQACVLGALGMAFTTWRPGRLGIVNMILTFGAATYTLVLLRDGRCRGSRLALSGLPWVAYVLVVLIAGTRLQG
jgi:cation:H+ antiporter